MDLASVMLGIVLGFLGNRLFARRVAIEVCERLAAAEKKHEIRFRHVGYLEPMPYPEDRL